MPVFMHTHVVISPIFSIVISAVSMYLYYKYDKFDDQDGIFFSVSVVQCMKEWESN